MSDEINGRVLACQLMVAGLAARLANEARDPLAFISAFRDEMHAVAKGVRLDGAADEERLRFFARQSLDELFGLMKPPSQDDAQEDSQRGR